MQLASLLVHKRESEREQYFANENAPSCLVGILGILSVCQSDTLRVNKRKLTAKGGIRPNRIGGERRKEVGKKENRTNKQNRPKHDCKAEILSLAQ